MVDKCEILAELAGVYSAAQDTQNQGVAKQQAPLRGIVPRVEEWPMTCVSLQGFCMQYKMSDSPPALLASQEPAAGDSTILPIAPCQQKAPLGS
jgi:hypothetical protein